MTETTIMAGTELLEDQLRAFLAGGDLTADELQQVRAAVADPEALLAEVRDRCGEDSDVFDAAIKLEDVSLPFLSRVALRLELIETERRVAELDRTERNQFADQLISNLRHVLQSDRTVAALIESWMSIETTESTDSKRSGVPFLRQCLHAILVSSTDPVFQTLARDLPSLASGFASLRGGLRFHRVRDTHNPDFIFAQLVAGQNYEARFPERGQSWK